MCLFPILLHSLVGFSTLQSPSVFALGALEDAEPGLGGRVDGGEGDALRGQGGRRRRTRWIPT